MSALTHRQMDIWNCVAGFLASAGRPPTVREIAAACRIKSPNSVTVHLAAIVRAGWLTAAADGTSRGLSVPGLAAHLAPVAREYLAAFAPAGPAVPS